MQIGGKIIISFLLYMYSSGISLTHRKSRMQEYDLRMQKYQMRYIHTYQNDDCNSKQKKI